VDWETRVYELCLELLFLYALRFGHHHNKRDENRIVNEKQKSYKHHEIRAKVWKMSASLMEGNVM
jgi:hypothetical protein